MNIPSSITTMLAGIILTLISLWYGQNHGLMPAAASEEAHLVDDLFNLMMTIGTGLFILVQGVIVVSIFRFRRKPGDEEDGPATHGNIPLEILWTSIPAVIVLGLSVYSFEVYNSMGGLNPMDHSVAHGQPTHQMAKMPGAAIAAPLNKPASPQSENSANLQLAQLEPRSSLANDTAYVVNALGLQYAWIFTYPDTGVVSGELHVPVGQEVLLNINAQDVLHAFWVPEYRVKQDAIPGRQSELRFTPKSVGEYPVICAELCGPYHGAMKTKVIAHTPEDFATWMEEQKVASAEGIDGAVALNPADQSTDQFLEPFVKPMGIDTKVLDQLQPQADHSLHHTSYLHHTS